MGGGGVPSPVLSDIKMYQITQLICPNSNTQGKVYYNLTTKKKITVTFFYKVVTNLLNLLSKYTVTFKNSLIFKVQRFLAQNELELTLFIKPANNSQNFHLYGGTIFQQCSKRLSIENISDIGKYS